MDQTAGFGYFLCMNDKKVIKHTQSAGTLATEPASPKMRAVAFRIEDKVYEGHAGASHSTLYNTLLRNKRVSADTLDAWISVEKNHGFVTESGEFLDRSEVFRRCGAARSQDLQAKGIFTPAQ